MAYFSLQNFKNFINYETQHNFSITQMLNSRAYVIWRSALTITALLTIDNEADTYFLVNSSPCEVTPIEIYRSQLPVSIKNI